MEIELKRFGFVDYLRMLKLTLKPETSKELDKTFLGYVVGGIKGLFDRTPRYKFAILMNGKFVGSLGIYKENGFYGMGYYVLPKYRGKGIATIAARRLLDKMSGEPDVKMIRAETKENNLPSLNVLRKNKFKIIRRNKRSKDIVFEKRLR